MAVENKNAKRKPGGGRKQSKPDYNPSAILQSVSEETYGSTINGYIIAIKGEKTIISIIRLSAKGTDGVMKLGCFRLKNLCYTIHRSVRYTTQTVEVSGGAV